MLEYKSLEGSTFWMLVKDNRNMRHRDVVELIRSGNHLELGVKERQ